MPHNINRPPHGRRPLIYILPSAYGAKVIRLDEARKRLRGVSDPKEKEKQGPDNDFAA